MLFRSTDIYGNAALVLAVEDLADAHRSFLGRESMHIYAANATALIQIAGTGGCIVIFLCNFLGFLTVVLSLAEMSVSI